MTVGPTKLFCSLKIPPLIKERTLVDEVNTVIFYLTLPYFALVDKNNFLASNKKMGLCLYIAL